MATEHHTGGWAEEPTTPAPGVAFDARIGERFELDSVAALWVPRASTRWSDRLRTARGTQPVTSTSVTPRANALVCNISVSGAGMIAPAEPRCEVGGTVDVTIGPGSDFVATVRRVLPSAEMGLAFYGVEFVSSSDVFQEWLHRLIDLHRARRNP